MKLATYRAPWLGTEEARPITVLDVAVAGGHALVAGLPRNTRGCFEMRMSRADWAALAATRDYQSVVCHPPSVPEGCRGTVANVEIYIED